jgi:RNA polymerase sigma factor (sigma-70 family)
MTDVAKEQMNSLIDYLRRAVLAGGEGGLSDGQLLECFVSRREEAAMAALVRRHGPMVWCVCRRILCNHHDAEDAFQATFLVLVRKAASILPREMVGNWLYGVAHQTALKARATTAKRQAREKQVKEMPEPAAVTEPDLWHDLEPLLDQELSRLPDKYRVAIVLCDLEGKTRKEVAQQLKIPEGTLSSRLTKARTMLAKRLARQGLMVSGGALAAVLTQKVASAGMPTSVASSTIKTASLFAAGNAVAGIASIKVAALTEGVLKTMLITKLKVATVVLLAVSMIGLSTTVMTYRTLASDQGGATNHAATKTTAKDSEKNAPDAEKPKGDSAEKGKVGDKPAAKSATTGSHATSDEKQKARSDENEKRKQRLEGQTGTKDKLHALLKERLEIVKRMADRIKREHERGVVGQEVVWQADLRVYKAELDLRESTKERIPVLEKIVNVYKKKEEHLARLQKQNQGTIAQDVVNDAKLERLEAEIALEREKAKLTPPSE